MLQELPTRLEAAKLCPKGTALREISPLTIGDNVPGSSNMCNFKEIWTPRNAATSLKASRMYEAGGSLYWLDTNVQAAAGELDSFLAEPSWEDVLTFEQAHIPAQARKADGRLYFTQTLTCYNQLQQLVPPGDGFPTNLFMMSGKIYLFAWFTAMARALASADDERLLRLHEMALTVTVRVHVEAPMDQMLTWSMHASELLRTAEAADTFVLFAKKVRKLTADLQSAGEDTADLKQVLEDRNILFNRAKANKTMVTALNVVMGMLGQRMESVLLSVDREFGSEVWTSGYNKLMRLGQLASKIVQQCGKAGADRDVIHFCLEVSLMCLRRGYLDASFFKLPTLDSKGNDRPGWIAVACTKYFLLQSILQAARTAADMGEKQEPALRRDAELMEKLCNPIEYDNVMPAEEAGDADAAEGDKSGGDLTEGDIDAMDALAADCSKGGKLLACLVRDLFQGEYEADLKTVTNVSSPWDTLQQTGEKETKLGKALKAAMAAWTSAVLSPAFQAWR